MEVATRAATLAMYLHTTVTLRAVSELLLMLVVAKYCFIDLF